MKLKKLDYVVIIVLTILTIVSFIITLTFSNRKYDSEYVEIHVDGKLYKKVPLNNNEETIEVITSLGKNVIQISKGKAHISEADCPDKVCIKDGYIDNPSKILVCLPNKVVVQVIGNNKQATDDNSY